MRVVCPRREARQVWVQVITRDKTDAGVPAVQTLRNSIMAASFMATSEALAGTAWWCLRSRGSACQGCHVALSAARQLCSAFQAWLGLPSMIALLCRSMRVNGSQRSAASAHRSDEDRVAGHHCGVHLPASRFVVCICFCILECSLTVHCIAQDTDPIVSNAGSHGLISTQARATASPRGYASSSVRQNQLTWSCVHSAQWKLASTEFMLLMSFLFFLQAIRLWSFLVRT